MERRIHRESHQLAHNLSHRKNLRRGRALRSAPDVREGRTTLHTLWIANDNDFLQTVPDENGNQIPNPNQFFVVGFTDSDLRGSKLVPQQFRDFDR
jgi:hypothetical protein